MRPRPPSTHGAALARPLRAGLLVAVLFAGLGERAARAYDFEIGSRTEAFGYQLRRYDRDGVQFLNLRRLSQYFSLRIFNLLDPGQDAFVGASHRPPTLLTFTALGRLDADFGNYSKPSPAIADISTSRFMLLLGGLEGRNFFGWVDFSLGRQVDAELFEFFAFDGLKLRINSPFHLFVESHFGTQVARAHPLGSAVFETDGTSGDGTDEAWSPTFGVAVGVEDLRSFDLRLAYRGTASKAKVRSGSSDEIWGIDEEFVFASASYELPVLKTRPTFGLKLDLLTGEVDDLMASVTQRIGARHDLEVEVLRSRPHFDGDSIFNLFATEPWSEVAARYRLRLFEELSLSARFGWRRFFVGEKEEGVLFPDAFSSALGARLSTDRVRAGLEGYFLGGYGGTSTGADLSAIVRVIALFSLEGRLTLVYHDGDEYGAKSLLAFGAQVGGRLHPIRGVLIHLLCEDNVSRLTKSALRLLAVVDLELAP
jgi:hypothetical protein